MFRIGIGNDTHRLVDGRPLMLGGVHVPPSVAAKDTPMPTLCCMRSPTRFWARFAKATSGRIFPTAIRNGKTQTACNCFRAWCWLAHERGLQVVNVDSTIMLETPKLRPYVFSMRENIAEVLGVELSCVSVKAKTGEGLDAVGQGLAVSAQAVVLSKS